MTAWKRSTASARPAADARHSSRTCAAGCGASVRGHDKPYAIFEPFGARADGDFDETEAFVLDMIRQVAEGQRDSDCRFDLFSVDFWVDYRGDLTQCDPERFPNGLTRIHDELTQAEHRPRPVDRQFDVQLVGRRQPGDCHHPSCSPVPATLISAEPPSRSARCTRRHSPTTSRATACGC